MKKLAIIFILIFVLTSYNESKPVSITEQHTQIYHQDLAESIMEFTDEETPVDSLYFPEFLKALMAR